MPIRYDIASMVPQAEAGFDPVNAMAQMQQLQYQRAQMNALAQRGQYQDLQAQMAAAREGRQAETAQQETKLKKLDELKRVFELSVNSQADLDRFVPYAVEAGFPALAESWKGVKYTPEWKMGILSPEKAAELARPRYREVGGETYVETASGGLRPAVIEPAQGATGADVAEGLLRRFEGFRAEPYFDVNANRVGYGSSTITTPEGKVQPVVPGAKVTQEDAERDLSRRVRTEFIPRAAEQTGVENWSRLPANVQGALASVAYNYGSLPDAVVKAVRSGDTAAIAKSVEGLASDNKGVNAERRMSEAQIIRGSGQPVTTGTKTVIKGQTDVERTLGRMESLYGELDKMAEIPSERRGALENVGAYFRGTSIGQEAEKARATPAQSRRNELKTLTRALLNDIKKATGMSAQEINSNFELKNMLETLSDPTQSIESVRNILADISTRYGSGKIAGPAAAPEAPAAETAPRVIDFSQLPKRR